MTSASPETRKEAHGTLSYEWREASLSIGGGVSDEGDYHASVVDVGGQFDFDHKRSSLAWGVSHAVARAAVTLPSTWAGWVDTRIGEQAGIIRGDSTYADGTPRLEIDKTRREWSFDVSMSRVATRPNSSRESTRWPGATPRAAASTGRAPRAATSA